LEELYVLLTRRGFEVTESIPDRAALDLDTMAPQHDLYVLKARTELPFSFASVLHERGAKVLNPPASSALVLNKIVATAMMRDAGIPTPRSWAVADRSLLSSIASTTSAPLIIKPFDGIHSQNVTLVRELAELGAVPVANGPLLVQEFVEGCTERLKVHCVGEQVFATRKPFSLGGDSTPGQACAVSDEVREIARRCGALFGMGLYGLDVLVPRDGPVVVDVNSFPGYAGVPRIAEVIADYIDGYARGRYTLLPGGRPVGRDADACA
jgi:glutathione synthase/RimK-type ligase-like ATP-grasp enzyme